MISQDQKERNIKQGQKTGAEQVVLKLRQIKVQTAQGKNFALANPLPPFAEKTIGFPTGEPLGQMSGLGG